MLPYLGDDMVSMTLNLTAHNQLSFLARITSATPTPNKTMCLIVLHYGKHGEYKRKYARIVIS